MPVRVGRADRAAQTQREVLDAARAVFLAEGFHGATLDGIAAAAGYTKGAVYSRYASKADLFLALLEERIEARREQNEALLRALDGGGLGALARRWSQIQHDDLPWTLLVAEFRIHAARNPELNARYAELHRRTLDGIAEVVDHAAGDTGVPARDLAQFIFAVGLGTTIEQAADPAALPPGLVADLVGRIVGGSR